MQVDFFSGNVARSSSLFAHVVDRTTQKLSRFADKVGRIVVRMVDVNGRRRGDDKLCQIEASIPGGKTVFASAIDRDAYTAADRAILALKSTLARKVERNRRR